MREAALIDTAAFFWHVELVLALAHSPISPVLRCKILYGTRRAAAAHAEVCCARREGPECDVSEGDGGGDGGGAGGPAI